MGRSVGIVRARKSRKALVAGIAAAATLGGAWAFYQEVMRPAPLETLVPESAFMFAGGDARWVWDATNELREGPKVQQGFRSFEKELGLSVEKDIVPWAGQVAGAMLSMDPKQPQAAFFIEVRDPVQYYMTMTRLRTQMEQAASRYWKGTGYNGVPLRYTYVGRGKNRTPVSTAWLKGWLVVGVGNGAAKRVIDTWQDRKPSIADNSTWASTTAGMPQERVFWGGVNTAMFLEAAPRGVQMPQATLDMTRAVTSFAATEVEDGFRMVTFTQPTAPASRAFYHKLAGAPAVNEDILDRLPDGTFFSFAFGNPGLWLDAYKPMFDSVVQAEAPNAEVTKMVEAAMERYKPIEEIVRRCEDGMAFGVTYRPESGFGLAIVGECGSMETARKSADDLREFIQKFEKTVTVSEDRSTYKMLVQGGDKPPVAFRPAWSVNGEYLIAGTHEMWLQPGTGAERIPLPEEARGAQTVSKGNFRFVEAAMRSFAPEKAGPGRPDQETLVQAWLRTGLSDAHWWSYSRIHEAGGVESAAELRNWPWRAALRTLVEQQRAEAAAPAETATPQKPKPSPPARGK